jgi:mono/diheme cytochrome c family protein
MLQRSILVVLFVLFGSLANAQPVRDPARGELLYSTHCIACHDLQVHWRDKRLVRNWMGLRAEVRRWQKISSLGWNNEDIAAVAQYLNTHYYHYPEP